ncbi:MAG: hypothetical protein LBE35_07305 [Clostridiales bacterium]|jgi:hypothetical protein|nr:hypothetical protein [Clostridiales bacterium]
MKILVFTLVFLILAGCSNEAPPQPELVEVAAIVHEELIYLELKIERIAHITGKFEPAGIFLGAHISADPTTGSIADFQAYMGVEHAIFAHSMRLDDDFPLLWFVENIANSAAPLITLHPPTDGHPFDLAQIADFAHQTAIFNLPNFVQLFPLNADTNFVPSDYIAFFRAAHEIFAEISPNTALIWGFDAEILPRAAHFFPGGDAVDWINLEAYKEIDPEGDFEVLNLRFFYEQFQEIAPLMLTVAVSNFSAENSRHFPAEAAEKIAEIYASLEDFPRLGAVIYSHHGNFRLNNSNILIEAYQSAASAANFQNFVENKPFPRQEAILRATPHHAIARGFNFYIPRAALNLPPNAEQVLINGQIYHPIAAVITHFDADFFANKQEGLLVLQLNSP